MKLLLSAYACEPGKGSEPGIGWNCVLQAARFHDVWVLTRSTNRAAIESVLTRHPLPNVTFVYCDLPRAARFWKKGTRGLYPYYYLWQIQAFRRARELHRKVEFEVSQHVTFVNYWMPSLLPLLPVPFIWGPVGGGESAPAQFQRTWPVRARFHERLRDAARARGRLDPLVRVCAKRAALALAPTDATRKRLEALGCRRVLLCPETALSENDLQFLDGLAPPPEPPFRLISLGRLLHWKGFDLALKAFSYLHRRSPSSQYWIVGDGPERAALAKLARQLGLADSVVFWGWLSRSQAIKKLASCHTLVHASLHDTGGWVCLEAMAAGRPVVCLDLGGPAMQVDDEAGIKVPAVSVDQTISDIAGAFLKLAKNPVERTKAGEAGKRRVRQHFLWDSRGEFYRDIRYEAVNGGSKGKC